MAAIIVQCARGHTLLGDKGSFWSGLGAVFLGLVSVLVVLLAVRGIAFPVLLLLPLARGRGLRVGNEPSG